MLGPLFVYLKQGTQRRRFSQSTQEGEGAQSFYVTEAHNYSHTEYTKLTEYAPPPPRPLRETKILCKSAHSV